MNVWPFRCRPSYMHPTARASLLATHTLKTVFYKAWEQVGYAISGIDEEVDIPKHGSMQKLFPRVSDST
ncbi:hypothetical protein [Mesorhizobium sp. WSM3862]|uniref:hypothetical protein n=1 Tax=Mesorhizobium sp. WSM3862 TaxID=632858 RepID=UPI001596751B|nr:hypothetical protein [Mesorhizobium sp. WSM3862]